MKFSYHRAKKREAQRQGHAIYGTARWKRLRLMVLRQSPVCEICAAALATEVDHKNGDNQDMRLCNLQSLCKPCHSKKTQRQDNAPKAQSQLEFCDE